MELILYGIVLGLIASCTSLELSRDLMMYQQNSYRPERYRRWLGESGDTTSLWRLLGLVIFFIAISTLSHPYASAALIGMFGLAMTWNLAVKKYKKPLAWTARARRIYSTALVLAALIAIVSVLLFAADASAESTVFTLAVAILACYCGSHLLIMAAGYLLMPVEKAINRRYYNDAAARLASMPDLKIVGITGSYGKTSTKHYLCRILSEQFDTLMTPGSYNTTLGVIRTVREMLKPYNEVFIVEMGAKQPGDIKEICDLVHPTVGIVTAVGPQHLESFKTIERVQSTKFELVDSLPADGLAVVNNDFEKIADRPVDNVKSLRYAVASKDADYRAVDVKYSSSGTTFTIAGPDGYSLPLSTRLLGEVNVSDLLVAAVTAHSMGVTDANIASAVASIDPVEHRLSVKKTAGGITILDDAFNSNPLGSRMALEVLGAMGPGRRIVITPGMIELGDRQYELNREFGCNVARHADIAIVVGHYNRDAIVEGIEAEGRMDKDAVHTVDSFAEAQKLLTSFVAKDDVVLYENDLPDTFK